MMRTLWILLAGAASAQTGASSADPYAAVMQVQYAAHTPPVAQRSDEAQRTYDAYLKSIGQKTKRKADDSVSNAEDQPH